MDYQGNSKNVTGKEEAPAKNIEKVVVDAVLIQKKPLGKKIKDIFIEADFKSVGRFVVMDVLIPAAKNMIVDSVNKGVNRVFYGDRAVPGRSYGPGPRITYNSPISRSYPGYPGGSPLPGRVAPNVEIGPRRSSRYERDVFILTSREDAERVLEMMNEIISNYEVASVADLNELVGHPSTHVDNKWGWVFLGDVPIRQVREGYLIDLPDAEPIK